MTHVLPAKYKKTRLLQDAIPRAVRHYSRCMNWGVLRNTVANQHSGDSVRDPMNRLQGCIRF